MVSNPVVVVATFIELFSLTDSVFVAIAATVASNTLVPALKS